MQPLQLKLKKKNTQIKPFSLNNKTNIINYQENTNQLQPFSLNNNTNTGNSNINLFNTIATSENSQISMITSSPISNATQTLLKNNNYFVTPTEIDDDSI